MVILIPFAVHPQQRNQSVWFKMPTMTAPNVLFDLVRHVHALESSVVVVLLKSRHSGTAIELRAAAALLVAVVLAKMWREQSYTSFN